MKSDIELLDRVVMFYDNDRDGLLSYSEFKMMISSNEDYALRRSTWDRVGSNESYALIDKSVICILIKLIQSELNLVMELSSRISALRQLDHFSIKALFDFVEINGFITPSSIMKLFDSFYDNPSFEDVANVMRRLDFNKDNRIDYNEFNHLFNIENSNKEELNQSDTTFNHKQSGLSKESQLTNDSSTISNRDHLAFKPIEDVNENLNRNSNANCSLTMRKVPLLKQKELQNEINEDSLIIFLLTIMDMESALEEKKSGLVLQYDFNIETLFSLFKLNSHLNVLYPNNVREGIEFFDISPTEKDIKLFFRRFNLGQNGFISYAEFFDIFIPFEKEFRDMTENRSIEDYVTNKPQLFELQTNKLIKAIIALILEYESHLELMRNTFRFNALQESLFRLFDAIDYKSNGWIINLEVLNYLTQKKRVDCSMRECNLLHIRLDKNRNGKVDKWELIDEFLPLNCFHPK